MKATNSKLFPSKDKTRELIRSGKYISVLQEHLPFLKFWKNKFDTLDGNEHPELWHIEDFAKCLQLKRFLKSYYQWNMNIRVRDSFTRWIGRVLTIYRGLCQLACASSSA